MKGLAVALSLSALAISACSPSVDLKRTLEVADVTTGWFDAGIVGGKNKLVPSLTFRLKKPPDADVPALSVNVVFKAEGDTDHWDDVFVQHVDFIDRVQTGPVTVRAEKGYTGDPPQSRLEMLKNSQFRDLSAQVFAKQSSSQWTELQRVKIARQLLTQ